MRIYLPNLHNQFSLPPFSHRNRQRRHVKSPKYPCHVTSSSSLNSLISEIQIPLLNQTSILNLTPLLALASGFAIYLSQNRKVISSDDRSSGEWTLFTSPTPFNRFVMLRCASIRFEGGGGGVNERLVKEERHFVRLSSGRIRISEVEDLEDLVYRRVCVGMEDGGVVAIDWPEELEMEEERGLDMTVVIVAGTGEGSGERCLREFVCECLRRGCFPLVMNPRGCAGSPLTTPR